MRKGFVMALASLFAICLTMPAFAADKEFAKADKAFVKSAANGGMMEVQMGQLATKNATSQEVKDFGQMMVTDHGKANDELKSLAATKELKLPTELKGMQKAKGRLFPFGIFHILRAMKTAKSVTLMIGAVIPEYQKQGLNIYLSISTIKEALKRGMHSVDTHVVMEENDDMSNEFKRYGAFMIKKFRVYQKAL